MSLVGTPKKPINGVARSDSKISAKALFEQRKKYSNSNVIMQDTSQYHVQHLSTFIMDKSESIASVNDAIKKLKVLDTKNKIWTQEMLLQVTDKSIKLLDSETKEELENFPLAIVHHCQTLLKETQRYPSILLLVCQDNDQHHPDIHFFYCDEVEAELVHADIDSALGDNKCGNKMRPQTLKLNQEKMKRQRETIIPPSEKSPKPNGHVTAMEMTDESHKKFAQRIEKDVQILNCTLDDIEIFVARLHKAAEAFAQLNQRNKGKKNKKRAPAEGMLTLRAKPPSEAEFIDCLQKLKLSFNLLAQLRKHIQNPNASELIHFLFGPLELILQTCGSPELARAVISPHLSRDAVDFLRGHLTPKEMTIYELLGDGWTRARADWPKNQCAPLYVPKFRSGWEPPVELFRTSPWETESAEVRSPKPEYKKDREYFGPQSSPPNGSPAPKKHVKIRYHFVARNANELSVLQNEVLEVLEDGKQWWKLRNRSGQAGYVPYNILDVIRLDDPQFITDPPYNPPYAGPHSPSGSSGSGSNSHTEMMDELTNELMHVISTTTKPPPPIFKPPRPPVNIPLTNDSTPSEVTAWLNANRFSKTTVERLGILTGAQLLSVDKEHLMKACGGEGSRVYSLMTVQKSQLEKQRRSELQEIMMIRKEKIESATKTEEAQNSKRS